MIKKILVLFMIIFCFSCSSEDTPDSSENKTAEYYNIKYEVVGTGMAYLIQYSNGNDETVEEKYVTLPFTKEFRFRTKMQGEENTTGYVTKIFRVYGYEEQSNIQEIRIFIDGELECADTDGPSSYNSDIYLTPWTCSFEYLRREP